MASSVTVTADYGDGTRSRGFALLGALFNLKALLLIPHFFVLYFVQIVAFIGAWIGYWAILFTGKQPEGISNLVYGLLKWQNRANGWLVTLTDDYPPFGFDADHAVVTEIVDDSDGTRSRGWAVAGIFGVKAIGVIIQLIIVAVVGIIAFLGAYVNYWVILFTGTSIQGVHDLVVRVTQANTRLAAWIFSLIDDYPPFSLD